MEEKVIKAATVIITAISIIVAGTLLFFPQLHIRAEENRELRAQEAIERKENMDALEMLQYNTANVDSQEGISFDQQLRIALPENVTPEDVSIENDYLTQTITIKIPGADENYLYNYPMIGKSYHIDNLTYESESEYGVIEISLDSVVELQKTSDEHYIYMDFLTPHEVYDKVVVIDAGHGGNAPGATKQGINEKDIDLAIVLKVKELFDEAGDESVGVYYTRTDDSNPSLEQRVDMANKAGADLFISVHNNSTKSGRMSLFPVANIILFILISLLECPVNCIINCLCCLFLICFIIQPVQFILICHKAYFYQCYRHLCCSYNINLVSFYNSLTGTS